MSKPPLTTTIYCKHCHHRAQIMPHLLDDSVCLRCGSPLAPTTPESLARDAINQTLNTLNLPNSGTRTHKRDLRAPTPDAPRGRI